MAKRNRYREMESLMTKVIIIDALVFVLYLVSAGMLAAACITYILPVIITFIFTQKTLLQVKQGGSKQ